MRKHGSARLASAILPMAIAISSPITRAQDQPTTRESGTDAEWRRRVESKIEQLEQENRELRQQVGDVAKTQKAVMDDAQSRGILTVEGGQPRLTTPDWFDLNKYASEGDFPGSIRLPGTKTSMQIGGFVQLDAIFDSDRIDNDDAFVVSSIPTGGEKTGAGNTNFSVRQTRLFMKTETPTDRWSDLVTYIEMDFFGTDGTEPRLRHAYGQIGKEFQLLAGQTWSAFQDATIFPGTLDSQGPPGLINSRRAQVRARKEFNKQWAAVMSLEDPKTELTVPTGFAGELSTPLPDIDGHVRWTPDWGHLQLSGVMRFLQFDPDIGSRESELGYGLNLTGSFKTIKIDDKHTDAMLFQIAGGNGIARYINDTSGLGLDGTIGTVGEGIDGLATFSGMLGYQHWWDRKWASTLAYSFVTVDNSSDQAPTDYHSGQYGVANVRYFPADRVMYGAEVLYGVREDNDGSTGDDVRLQFSAQYRF